MFAFLLCTTVRGNYSCKEGKGSKNSSTHVDGTEDLNCIKIRRAVHGHCVKVIAVLRNVKIRITFLQPLCVL